MLYSYVCEQCGRRKELIRTIARRDEPVVCDETMLEAERNVSVPGDQVRVRVDYHVQPMRREISTPTVHYKGAGWTRRPPIMSDPIAAGHPGQRSNWGVDSIADYGDPNVSTPYKTVIGGDESALSAGETVGPGDA